VLARAAQLAGIDFDSREAHSAIYDAERTADLFCHVCNGMHESFVRAEEKARALGWKDGAPAPIDLVEGD
jgi:DNA polymerase III epsilon subunit-like protein